MTTNRYLALYTGPNGPLSHEISCSSLEEACEAVREHGDVWYDNANDCLGLPPDASEHEVLAALKRDGWRTSVTVDVGYWDVYLRA